MLVAILVSAAPGTKSARSDAYTYDAPAPTLLDADAGLTRSDGDLLGLMRPERSAHVSEILPWPAQVHRQVQCRDVKLPPLTGHLRSDRRNPKRERRADTSRSEQTPGCLRNHGSPMHPPIPCEPPSPWIRQSLTTTGTALRSRADDPAFGPTTSGAHMKTGDENDSHGERYGRRSAHPSNTGRSEVSWTTHQMFVT